MDHRPLLSCCLIGTFLLAGCSSSGNDPPAAASGSGAVIYDRSGVAQTYFWAPNANVGCGYKAGSGSGATGTVRCEIVVKTWAPPVKPASCQAKWGSQVALSTRAEPVCATETVRVDPMAVALPYGTAIRVSPFTCSSTTAGIGCVNTANGASFLIGREHYEVHNP